MRKGYLVKLVLVLIQLNISGCVDKFNPPEMENRTSYLVVEGFLNTGNRESTIKLSRTVNLSEGNSPVVEEGATVTVEREGGGYYRFVELGNGIYTYPPEFISEAFQFRLMIKTKDGEIYYSKYVTPKQTPEIDSITYEVVQNGEEVQLNVNAHDPTGKARFYRWELEETWEYTSAFSITYVLRGGKLERKDEDVFRCWKTNTPRNIMIGTTVKLNEDILRNNGIASFPISSSRFLIRYSAFVRQHAISQEEYAYWTALAKTTENTGSIFDPMPGLITGNLYCETDAKQLVFGFFNVGAPKEKRVFLTPNLGQYPYCYTYFFTPEQLRDTGYDIVGEGVPLGENYGAVPRTCVDCQLGGGTLTRPTYW